MKVKSDDEVMKLIEMARAKGSLTFLSEHPRGDQQKVYRMLVKVPALPLFEGEYDFTVRAHKDSVTIERKVKDMTILIDTPVKEQQVIQPKQRKKKEPRQFERWRKDIEKAELNPLFNKDNPECRAAWEYFDLIKHAMDIWQEGDEELEQAITGQYELFHILLAKSFGHKAKEPEYPDGPLTIRDKIEHNAKLRGVTEDAHELKLLLIEHERLLKQRDDEDSKKPLF